MMTLDKRTAEILAREEAIRAGERAQRLHAINDRYDRLLKAGAVLPERYNIAPINPTSLSNQYTFG